MFARWSDKLTGDRLGFKSIFTAVAFALVAAGCSSSEKEKKKEYTAIRFHAETIGDSTQGIPVTVLRSAPITLRVEADAAADERDIVSARLDDVLGGYAITVNFTTHGRMVMEMASVSRLGLRLAVKATWTIGPGQTATRWLAAPVMNQGLSSGAFSFSPDCTREEALQIVRGINNVAVKLKNQDRKPGPESESNSPDDAIKAYKEAR